MRIDFSESRNDAFAAEVVKTPKYLLDDAVTWIQNELSPEDVFTPDQLETWAKDNGYVEETE